MSTATLTINLSAIAANYRQLQSRVGNAECAAVVKANAYGLGVREVALALEKAGCQIFFVATLEEGIDLRGILPERTIYVFHGVEAGEAVLFSEYRLAPVLNSLEQVKCWNSYAEKQERVFPAILHMDTGMCRLGLCTKELGLLEADESQMRALKLDYVMSHLACADEPEHYKNLRQLTSFEEMPGFLRLLPRSLSNSSGIFLGERYHCELVRPGIALYGVNPIPGQPNPMQGVVTLKSPIIQLQEIDVPQTVGYGASYEALPGARIATVPVGYADGYLRALGGKAYGYIGGREVPVVGRVSMDLITLDVTAVRDIHVGAEIELIGGHIPVDQVAEWAGTIGYELLTRLGNRYKREYWVE